jgi:F-type H+-transporting ATPase subunit a
VVHVSLKAEPLFSIGPWTVTNSMIGAWIASIILLAAALYVSRRARIVPNRTQSLVELPFEFIFGVVRDQGGRAWRQILPLIATIFMFILVANWMGILPGVGTIGYYATENGEKVLVPYVRAAAADLNFTLALAIVAFATFVGFGIRMQGLRGYLKEVLLPEPKLLAPLMGPIELISNLSRLISLSMRLFGNVFAGEVLVLVLLAIGPVFVFVVFGLELLFGIVQALVFALLAMTYVVLATIEHHADGASGAEGDHGSPNPSNHPAGASASGG